MNKCKSTISSLLVIVMLVVSLTSCSLTKPRLKFNRLIDEKKYDEALALYRDKSDLMREEDAEEGFKKALDTMYQDYLEDNCESTYIISYVNELTSMNIGSLPEYGQKIVADVKIYESSKESFNEANKDFDNGFYYSALKKYQNVVDYDPNYEAAQKRITECIANYKQQKIDEAAELAANENYLNALNLLMSTEDLIGQDDDIDQLLEKYHHSFDDYILKNASSLAKSGEYDEAILLLTTNSEVFYDKTKLESAIIDYKDMAVTALFAEMNMSDLIANGNYKEALELIKPIRTDYKDSPTLEKTVSEVTDLYAEQEIEIVDKYMEKYDYKSAYNECVAALNLIPGQEDLIAKRDYCSPRLPVPLNDYFKSKDYSETWYLNKEECEDTHGNVYPVGTICMLGSYDFFPQWVTFDIGGKYDLLSIGFATDGFASTALKSYGRFAVYGDGELIFDLKISDDTKPEDRYDIDISGVKELEFGFIISDGWTNLIVLDPELKNK